MENDEVEEKTIFVTRDVEDATVVVSRAEVEDIEDATVVVSRAEVEDIEDATVVVSRAEVDDSTISFSKPIEENTITGASGPQSFTNTFEDSAESPTPTSVLPIIEEEEVDAELIVEEYVDPQVEIEKTRSQSISTANINLATTADSGITQDSVRVSLQEAQKLMDKNKVRSMSASKIAIISVILGAAAIGATIAVLVNQ